MKIDLRLPFAVLLTIATISIGQAQTGVYTLTELTDGQNDSWTFHFGSDAVIMSRDTSLNGVRNVIGGPEAFGFNQMDFGYSAGYRLNAAVLLPGESRRGFGVSWTDFGQWTDTRSGALTRGVAFDDGVNLGNPWAGQNFINNSTYFTPVFTAATSTNENDEHEGFGPNAGFPADVPPTYAMIYKTKVSDLEVNYLRQNDARWYTFGMGGRHVDLNELSAVSLNRGTFRAADIAAPNGGLSHASLTGAGLNHLGGGATGWNDETAVNADNATLSPDIVSFFHQATTTNDLNGASFMFDANLIERERLLINGFVKAGVFYNHSTGTVTEVYRELTIDGSTYGRSFSGSSNNVAFVGNVGVNVGYRLSDWAMIRAGYEAMFVDGVALSPNQVDGIRGGSYQVQTNGNMLIHGLNLGLVLTY